MSLWPHGHWNWHLNFKRKAWQAQSQTWKPLQLLKVWGWKHLYCPTSQAMALQEGLPKPAGSSAPSLPWCHLKTTNKSVKSETFKGFCLLFRTGMWKDFHQNTDSISSSMCYRTGKYSVDRHVCAVCIFQPRNSAGWGSEGVNSDYYNIRYSYRPLSSWCILWS